MFGLHAARGVEHEDHRERDALLALRRRPPGSRSPPASRRPRRARRPSGPGRARSVRPCRRSTAVTETTLTSTSSTKGGGVGGWAGWGVWAGGCGGEERRARARVAAGMRLQAAPAVTGREPLRSAEAGPRPAGRRPATARGARAPRGRTAARVDEVLEEAQQRGWRGPPWPPWRRTRTSDLAAWGTSAVGAPTATPEQRRGEGVGHGAEDGGREQGARGQLQRRAQGVEGVVHRGDLVAEDLEGAGDGRRSRGPGRTPGRRRRRRARASPARVRRPGEEQGQPGPEAGGGGEGDGQSERGHPFDDRTVHESRLGLAAGVSSFSASWKVSTLFMWPLAELHAAAVLLDAEDVRSVRLQDQGHLGEHEVAPFRAARSPRSPDRRGAACADPRGPRAGRGRAGSGRA